MKKKLIRGSTIVFKDTKGGFTKGKEYKVTTRYENWLFFDGDNGNNGVHEEHFSIDWERSRE